MAKFAVQDAFVMLTCGTRSHETRAVGGRMFSE